MILVHWCYVHVHARTVPSIIQHTISDQTPMASEVLNTKQFNQFLNECEESVNKLMAEIAMKFYKLGFEEGLQAAIMSRIKTVSS